MPVSLFGAGSSRTYDLRAEVVAQYPVLLLVPSFPHTDWMQIL
jgi:hypothetical protein